MSFQKLNILKSVIVKNLIVL